MPGTVRLLVSAGPPLVAVPTLAGLLQPAAEEALRQAGLRSGDVTMELRLDLPEGTVFSQYPLPGDSVRAGRTVDLQVATQQPPAEIEGLEGVELPAPPAPEASGSQ